MEAVCAPPVEAGLPIRSPVTPAGGAGRDVDVRQRHRATHEASGRAVSAADALLSRRVVLPHLDAAYNLARWLTRGPEDARDAVEEAAHRAFASLASRKGVDARPRFLAIVRDAVLASHGRERAAGSRPLGAPAGGLKPPHRLEGDGVIDGHLRRLPPEFCEVLVLRELEGLSYEEIAVVAGIPVGTAMSRLARARRLMLAQGRELAPGRAAEAREDGALSPRL